MAPTGYLNEKRKDKACEVIVDPHRAPMIKQMFEKVANEQWSGRTLYQWLKNDIKFKTVTENISRSPTSLSSSQKTFYYGVFEYPEGIGKLVYGGSYSPHHEGTLRPDAGTDEAERGKE